MTSDAKSLAQAAEGPPWQIFRADAAEIEALRLAMETGPSSPVTNGSVMSPLVGLTRGLVPRCIGPELALKSDMEERRMAWETLPTRIKLSHRRRQA